MLINDKQHCSASRACLFMRLDVRGSAGLGGSDMVQSSWCRRRLMLKQTLNLRRKCLEMKYIGAFWCLCIVLLNEWSSPGVTAGWAVSGGFTISSDINVNY